MKRQPMSLAWIVFTFLIGAVSLQAAGGLGQQEAAGEPAQSEPAPAANPGNITIEAGITYENLTRGQEPWRRAYFQMVVPFAERKVVYGAVEEHSRFSQTDSDFTVGAYYPLGKRWTGLVEGSVSPTHNFLSKWSMLGQIEHSFGQGWGASAGVRHREYETAIANIGNLGVEKYIKNFRLAYMISPSHLEKAGFATAHRWDTNYYYGDSAINLILVRGSGVENIVPAGVLRTTVKLVNVNGTHWFAAGWALTYAANWHEQGTHYTRHGLTLGLRHRL